ncbi:MAG: 4-aminobutyrate aminotransferase GabT [bacterium ADurb.Bin243]|nr:MAG: 4-aminobutyrate aminotransferase GabT [bacterium ADurb.Bin243]
MNSKEITDIFNFNFAPFVRPYYQEPLIVSRAEGEYIWDTDGKKYLDAYSGVATVSLGHCNKRVNDAVKAQMDNFGHISYIYRFESAANYAKTLLNKCGGDYCRVFFTNSGSESVDLAIMIARAATSSESIFTFSEGYHGGTFLTKFSTGLDNWHASVNAPPEIFYITTPECVTCRHKDCETSRCICLNRACERFEQINKKGLRPILVVEPVLGVGGIITPPLHYFKMLSEVIDEYNVFLICDEVQTGFGRAGGAFFGFQKYGLKPDIVCMGKAIANGYPLGAVVFKEETSERVKDMLHFNTFGGNPLSIAAAAEVIKIIDETDILNAVEENGRVFLRDMRLFFEERPQINRIRGAGYSIGLDFESAQSASEALNSARSEGLLVGIGGRKKNVIRIQPPLTFTPDHFHEVVEIFKKVLK